MKEITLTQIMVITESDPAIFQDKVNEALQLHQDIKALEYKNSDPGIYSAILTYYDHREEPETTADIYAAAGKRYICNDCPHLELDPDRRSVTHYCSLHRDRVRLKNCACEDFLKALNAGADHLVTAKERQAQYDEMDRADLERRRRIHNETQATLLLKKKLLQAEKEAKEEKTAKTSEKYHLRK